MSDAKSFIPVIMSGGSGTRLWPVSRQAFPKQFCELFDGSLMAKTVQRLKPLGSPWTVTVADLKVLTEKTLAAEGMTSAAISAQALYEPRGRNTAPAIALLCRVLEMQKRADAIVGIFPADHLIQDEAAFRKCVEQAAEFARQGEVVTLGVKPTYPATGYGYIETAGEAAGATGALKAIGFREKPNEATAREFIKKGGFYWNAGMFVFKVDTMIAHLKSLAPKVWGPVMELKSDLSNIKSVYDQVEAISIDYAVMEKLKSHITIPCAFDWSDVGSWDAVAEIKKSAPAIEVEAKNNYVFAAQEEAASGKTVAFVGVDDLVVVDTVDATLIAKRGSSEKVKDVVDRLKAGGPVMAAKVSQHPFEVRPWGRFEILRDTDQFKSKTITVDAGAQISYQSHAKRAEHWIIVSGRGEVVLNDEVIPVSAGSHVFIPIGAKHRIRNTASASSGAAGALTFVEVQLGSYFGEDDIVRYEDTYGRA